MSGGRRAASGPPLPPGEGRGEGGLRRLPPTAYRQRGSALLLSIVLATVLIIVATAFIITARTENRAATNALRGLQAEAACRAGLAAAIYRAQQLYSLDQAVAIYTADSWHERFYDAGGPDLCPDSWVAHYDHSVPALKGEMRAKRWAMPVAASGEADEALKRQRGFSSEYYIAVADLDGKLHCNPKTWETEIKADDAKLKAMERAWMDSVEPFKSDLTRANVVATNIAGYTNAIWSLGEMKVAFGLNTKEEAAAIESFLTTYPRELPDPQRPAVNVNTARRDALKAIVRNVPGLDQPDGPVLLADRVADKLVQRRPFATRKDMEKALLELGQSSWNLPAEYPTPREDKLDEKQMNDLLNSLAGANPPGIDDSDFDNADDGIYKYNFDGAPLPESEGEHFSDDADATWGTEVKFVSQFYHIYVLGRVVSSDGLRVMAERRAHAVYDAGAKKILWFRWNQAAKTNFGD